MSKLFSFSRRSQCSQHSQHSLVTQLHGFQNWQGRGGEGAQKGKHLYYRCTDRVLSHPLPPTCKEGGINARLADSLVWEGMVRLMTSPELLKKQIERWMNDKRTKAKITVDDIKPLNKELSKLREEESRYNKAYGGGLFTIQQLIEYTEPLKARMSNVQAQIDKAVQMEQSVNTSTLPTNAEIETFGKQVVKVMPDLNFIAKKAIVMASIQKVVGNKEKLVVSGYIPIKNFNVFTTDRYCWASKCR